MTIEEKVEGMTFGSVFKSMLPSVVVGTASAVGAQEVASHYTSNPEAITLAGMVSQYVGGWSAYLPSHLYNNRDRLIEDGKVKWREYAKDIGSIALSDKVGSKLWAGVYGLTNDIALRHGIDPSVAGAISGLSSGTLYSAFTGYTAPKVNTLMNKAKDVVKRFRKTEVEVGL